MARADLRVVVVGAGVVGLATAWQLARRGAAVTVLDRGSIGAECSLGNTGWIVPALSAPVAAPGSVKQGLQMLGRRDNPFRIRPRLSPSLARWLLTFQRSAQPARYRAGAAAILALNERTLEHFDELQAAGVRFEMHDGGIAFLCLSEQSLAGSHARFDALGYPGEIAHLGAEATRELEPAVSERVIGSLHIKPERTARPETLTAGLADALRGLGARVSEQCAVRTLERRSRAWRIETDTGALEADRVVIAAGIWSRDFERVLGLRLPMQPGKGYSLTARGTGTAPRRALFFVEAMIGAAPYDGGVRLAGMLELAGMDASVDPRRLALIDRAVRTYLHGWLPTDPELRWAGLRPLPPDGLPIVGAVPGREGLFLATGHGMVGITLAPSTAALLAPLVLDGTTSPKLAPFRPDRF